MKNNDILKKKIIYRSTHRGTKEMDLLLGNFVKQHINNLNTSELYDLDRFTQIDDEVLLNLFFKKDIGDLVSENYISKMFKSFKV